MTNVTEVLTSGLKKGFVTIKEDEEGFPSYVYVRHRGMLITLEVKDFEHV